ncbi:MAG: hypothetical protein E7403_06525 [Ruminococcaceae bacterium]|nr:hypothetical protein [Oscillospiraceae bacterium]
MSELKLKIRNKIYTSGNHIVDTKNNHNAIVVFLGRMSSENLKPYVDNFFKDTLKSQIPGSKITSIVIENNVESLQQKISEAVKKVEFNPTMTNKLYISFVTLMDDEIFESAHKINIEGIEQLRVSALGGFAVEIFYDFYGIFGSDANCARRANARKTIAHFLDENNGGVNIVKRVYHQASPGNDYYRTSKSITFMILVSLIGKLEQHSSVKSELDGENYTWTTFALFEKNLASLVIYEMINKLLNNQVNGTEVISLENLLQTVKDELSQLETQFKKVVSVGDFNYIPITVRRTERKLSFMEKSKNIFSKDKISAIEFRKERIDNSVEDLISQQKRALHEFLAKTVNEEYIDAFIVKLIRMCTVMESINNSQNEALILKSLESCKKELEAQISTNSAPLEIRNGYDYFLPKYNMMLLSAKVATLEKIIEYFKSNVNHYVEVVQKHWNQMNIEVCNMINDFATFQDYFVGIGDLINDKTISLMSSYDEILEKIDVGRVIKAIDDSAEIYSSVLASYYDNVQAAGDIAKRFGDRNIVPDFDNISFCLFTHKDVMCPERLKSVVDDYWFREHEIAILFTAKNNITDCDNLPFKL